MNAHIRNLTQFVRNFSAWIRYKRLHHYCQQYGLQLCVTADNKNNLAIIDRSGALVGKKLAIREGVELIPTQSKIKAERLLVRNPVHGIVYLYGDLADWKQYVDEVIAWDIL